mmetsp:Transcript_70336/g.124219  ORF Transcript_70336/g.124219 Transcript_70336/m.124219 type:complete len:356 (-) Transcript_70336:71-1138(-)
MVQEALLPLIEAGLELEYQEGGTKLIVRDVAPTSVSIRNRGGEALAALINSDRKIRALDMSQSNISDNGIANLCLTLRQTNQLEELHASPVGHTGLEFLLGVVRRCQRLHTLSLEVRDLPTLVQDRQNISATDYDTSAYKAEKRADDEEEAPEDPEEAEANAAKAEQLKKLFAENDVDSGDEGGIVFPQPQGKERAEALPNLLAQLVTAVRQHGNLTSVACTGEAVPSDMQLDMMRAAEAHKALHEKIAAEKEEKGARTAVDALYDQMEEIRHMHQQQGTIEGSLPGEEHDESSLTRLGIRSYVGRRLFTALGEALFECQRFKSKENEAVSDSEGELAFIAMYIRQKLAQEMEGQ